METRLALSPFFLIKTADILGGAFFLKTFNYFLSSDVLKIFDG
jgi:hypothetical protein